ncbi:MAG: hypothetical protein KJ864_04665, partial [Candidatus Omnitrophica bacterium]|nr:hypothetical protein [Candidatus Omnitrophota bacterium]
MEFSKFFRKHGLFSDIPHKSTQISKEREKFINNLFKKGFNGIRKEILKIAKKHKKLEKAEDWIGNLCHKREKRYKKKQTVQNGSIKNKYNLYPVVLWIAELECPQNLDKTEGKLFDKRYYEGLNLLTLTIFPVDDLGQIDWEIFDSWAYNSYFFRVPPKIYFLKKKISLYEFFMCFDWFKQDDDSGSIHLNKNEVETLVEKQEKKNKQKPFSESVLRVQKDIEKTELLTRKIDQSKTLDKITHILIDKKIPAFSQNEIVTLISKRSRDKMIAEKVLFIDANRMEFYAQENNCNDENTVIFLKESSFEENLSLKFGGKIIKVDQEEALCFVDLVGLIGLARSIMNNDIDTFLNLYKVLANKPFELSENLRKNGFSCLPKIISLMLPPPLKMPVDDCKKCNRLLMKSLKSL